MHIKFLLASEHPIADACTSDDRCNRQQYEIAMTFKTSQLLIPITVIV